MAKKSKPVKKSVKKAAKKPVKKARLLIKKKLRKPLHKPKFSRAKKAPKPVQKMPKDALKGKAPSGEIEDMVVSLAGEDVLPLVVLLRGRENVSEFAIADRLNITVNQVRNMLYRLHKSNLVTFTRKKDKKKGWYIYYWTLDVKKLEDALFQQKKRQLAEFVEKLSKEERGKFFVCQGKCVRLTMEDAMEAEFHCPECGQLLVEQDNKRTIDNIKRRIEELSVEIKAEEERLAAEFVKLMARRRVVRKKPVKKAVKKKVVKKKIVKKIVKKAAKKPLKKVMKKVKKAVKKPVKKAVKKKIVKKAAKKAPAKKAVKRKVVKKVVKKAVKKGFFSGLKKVARKIVKRKR